MGDLFSLESWRAFWHRAAELSIGHGLLVVGILLGYVIAKAVLNGLVDAAVTRILDREKRNGDPAERSQRLVTVQGLCKSVLGYTLFFVMAVMLLDALGANVAGVVATAGIGGLAIGFGAQKLVRDVITGFFIIMEDQFSVGDYVTIGGAAGTIAGAGATGVVESIGMRITRIRDDQGRLWTLANGDIAAVINQSRAPVETYIEIGVAPTVEVEQAQKAVDDACAALFQKSKGKLEKAPVSIGVSGFDNVRTTIRVAIFADPRAATVEQLRIREAILDRLKADGLQTA